MSSKPENPDFGILQQIFADVANDMRRDPIEHLLVLTYEFDDQQLVNLLSGRRLADNVELQRNQLKFIADMRPVVIYDARKTREFNQLPHFLDLLPVNPGAYRCHHAKAYLFVTRATVRLVLGSFNLTRTGLFENREVFTDFFWNDKETADLEILSDFSKLLREGYSQWAQPAASSARLAIADTLDARVAQWKVATALGKHTLLFSGYGKLDRASGLQALESLWNKVSAAAPQKMLVVSPFFDRGDAFLADEIAKTIGAPAELHIVTDEANILKMGRRHYGPGKEGQVRKLSLIPAAISESERERIMRANDGARLDSLQISRGLHAKVIILCSGSNHLVYSGSANFTLKAWNGDNQELGVVSIEDGNANKLIAQVLAALGATENDAYQRLNDSSVDPGATDDEDYVEQPLYPHFLSGILLAQDSAQEGLVFHFRTDEPTRLQGYEIHWGTQRLAIEGAHSQLIRHEQAYMPLQGGRNLRFTPLVDREKHYLLPFVHDSELTRQQDLMLFPSPEDWMRYYLHPEGASGPPDGEYMPGEGNVHNEESQSSVDRDANIVIAMQRYLNLFSGVESAFNQRAIEFSAAGFANAATRGKELEQRLVEPLRVYSRLLEQEYRRKTSQTAEQIYLFRLGELVLMCGNLSAVLPELVSLTHELASGLTTTHSNATLDFYIEFVRSQLPHA